MMDPELGLLTHKDTPKMNPLIAGGVAVEHFKHVESYIDQVWRSAERGFPPGLKYLGYQHCSPQEELMEATKRKNTRRVYDTARSDFYMVKYNLEYKGVKLPPRHIYLPFVSEAGCIVIGGSRFNISPILADRVISIDTDSIFVRLLRDRLTFERVPHFFMIDGKRDTTRVPWSTIYHRPKTKQPRPTVKANCALLHYLLCKYGFTETFLKFGKCQPVVGKSEINRNTYPESDWVICSSTAMRPRNWGKAFWEPPQINVAIKREEFTPMVSTMVGNFFYIVDHFPSQISPEWIDHQRMWMVLLGQIIFASNANHGVLYEDIKDHMESLNEYMDPIVVKKLAELTDLTGGRQINDVYDLFALTIERFNDWIVGASDKVASMYDKELQILYYSLYEITSAIFKFHFKLRAASKKGRIDARREITENEIKATMNLTLKTGLIFGLIKGHGEVSTISSPGDNKATKITSILVPQSGSNRTNQKRDRLDLNDPAIALHVSIADIGGYGNLPKSEPSGRARANPHMHVDSKGVVQRNPAYIAMLDEVQSLIKAWTPDAVSS